MTKKKTNKKKFIWNKGSKTETIKLGDAEIKFRGLTYREVMDIAGMQNPEADILTLKIGTVSIKNLQFEEEVTDEDGNVTTKLATYEPTFEDYNCNGRTISILTDESFDDIFEPNFAVIGQAIGIIKELSGLTPEEVETVKFFRQGR